VKTISRLLKLKGQCTRFAKAREADFLSKL
jgi:hypothetical protein